MAPYNVSIAETLKAEVLAGKYDGEPLPGNAAIAERFDVNMKTAGRAHGPGVFAVCLVL